ncbi:hypothetical protein SALB1_3324 [Salinisphaera sp. LB1]|nr:hypothetical protein SALB1_3324 [Salinisphaera sp. LB1]
MHEAMGNCCPVIAYGRGCIPEVVSEDCGRLVEPGQAFVREALAQISAWLDNPAAFEAASKTAAARFAQTYAESQARWQAIMSELTGERNPRYANKMQDSSSEL